MSSAFIFFLYLIRLEANSLRLFRGEIDYNFRELDGKDLCSTSGVCWETEAIFAVTHRIDCADLCRKKNCLTLFYDEKKSRCYLWMKKFIDCKLCFSKKDAKEQMKFLDEDATCKITNPDNGNIMDINGNIIGAGDIITDGELLQYSCDEDSQFNSDYTQITCMGYNMFDKNPPTCNKIKCLVTETQFNSIQHGNVTGTDGQFIYHNEKAEYSCDEGYYIGTDHNEITCIEENTFDLATPFCRQISCAVSDPENGQVSTPHSPSNSFINYEEMATYSCNSEYVLITEHSTLTCTGSNNKFDNDVTPECKKKFSWDGQNEKYIGCKTVSFTHPGSQSYIGWSQYGSSEFDNSVLFAVKGQGDCYVGLSAISEFQGTDPNQVAGFEVGIGTGGGNSILIAGAVHGQPVNNEGSLKIGNLLSNEYKPYWISWTSETLQVGSGTNISENTLVTYDGSNINPLKFLSNRGHGDKELYFKLCARG